jgi:hypothetical protein
MPATALPPNATVHQFDKFDIRPPSPMKPFEIPAFVQEMFLCPQPPKPLYTMFCSGQEDDAIIISSLPTKSTIDAGDSSGKAGKERDFFMVSSRVFIDLGVASCLSTIWSRPIEHGKGDSDMRTLTICEMFPGKVFEMEGSGELVGLVLDMMHSPR